MKRKYRNKNIFLNIIILLLFSIVLVACDKELPDEDPSIVPSTQPSEHSSVEVDLFEDVFSEISLPSETITSINLPTSSTKVPEAKLSWNTNQFNVLKSDGFLIRPDEDVIVTLELFVTIGITTKTKKYTVKAVGLEDQVLSLETFKDPMGYASLGITNRQGQTNNFYVVNDELEFLTAYIDAKGKKDVIIKITNDLNLGAKYIGRLLVEEGLWDGDNPRSTPYLDGKDFRENTNLPQNHPKLLQDGVGQLIIDGRDGLMIYSETGITINHLTVHMKGNSNNIVFRNLEMRGIWEWDEIDKGDYKALDWDYFTIEHSKNIWLDHMTFRTSYDGIVDIKANVSNVTFSWLNLDFVVDDFIEEQFDELENNIHRYPFYKELRETVSKEDIATVAAGQKKAFNWGNTEGGPGFESITVTMHHVYAKNLQDRFPRLRRGDVHVYNTVLDSEELRQLRHIDMKVISQAVVPTEQGAILMENSRFVGVSQPIKTHQSSNLDPDFTGRFKIVDSQYMYSNDYYFGSSSDESIFNPWIRSNTNVDYDLPFFFRNYENLPYEYEMQEAQVLTKVFKDNPIGAGEITGFDWLEIINLIDASKVDKGKKIDEANIEGLGLHIAKTGTNIPTFIPSLYNFYTGESLRVDREYIYYVDTSGVNPNVPGTYEIEYEFILLHNEEVVIYKQPYVVYDPEGPNEIYDSNIAHPFDNILAGEVYVYEAEGQLYLLPSESDVELANDVLNEGIIINIDNTTVLFSGLDVAEYDYLHFVVKNDEKISEVFTHKIKKEQVVEIRNYIDINDMLLDLNSSGKYYKLMNDIDLTGVTLRNLNSDNVFSGIFDGQGYTIKNLFRHAYGGGFFHTMTNGKVKNITFENVTVQIKGTDIYDEDDPNLVIGVNKTSARAGIVVGQIKGGFGILENITIINSLVESDNNYSAILVGKVEGYSDAIIKNIYVIDSEVDQDGEYAGGITAGVANNSTALFENIYINNLKISERNTKMIGVIVGRAESAVTINGVVIINATIDTVGAVGGVIGKDDRKGQQIYTSITNVFVDINIVHETTSYRGNIIGNADLAQGHPTPITDNLWGTPNGSLTGVNNIGIIEMNELNNSWWQTNFSELIATGLWEVKNNLLVLKR